MNTCTLVVTGAPLTARCVDLAATLVAGGWETTVVATPSASAWLDAAAIETESGQHPLSEQRAPGQPKRNAPPTAVIVCPATFNTVAKSALGIADSYAHGVICESVGARIPTFFVPMINDKLWNHPALAGHLSRLASAGVQFIDPSNGRPDLAAVPSGTGDALVAAFDPEWVLARLNQHTSPPD